QKARRQHLVLRAEPKSRQDFVVEDSAISALVRDCAINVMLLEILLRLWTEYNRANLIEVFERGDPCDFGLSYRKTHPPPPFSALRIVLGVVTYGPHHAHTRFSLPTQLRVPGRRHPSAGNDNVV